MQTTPTEVQIFVVIVGVAAAFQIAGIALSMYACSRREQAFQRYFDEAKESGAEERFMSIVTSRACIGDSLRVVVGRWSASDYRRICLQAKGITF